MQFSTNSQGFMLSMASCVIKIAGARYVQITKIDVEDGVKAEPERGSGPISIGTAIGEYNCTFSFDQHLTEALRLQRVLAELSGVNSSAMALANVSIIFNAAAPRISGIAQPLSSILIPNVRFLGMKQGIANDGKSIVASWTTVVTEPVKWTADGVDFYTMDPATFAQTSSISIGLGGGISIGG